MQRPKKLLRASRACDFCHKRSIKCRPNVTDPQRCQNCLDFDVLCTYERPLKRGRALSGYNQQRHSPNYSQQLGPVQLRPVTQVKDAAPVRSQEVQNASPFLEGSCGEPETSKYQPAARHAMIDQWPQTAWGAFAAASAGTIVHLTNVYLQVVYPIFPLFHEPTLLQKVHDQEYLRSRSSFASLMAACALASARERDGALYNSIKNPSYNTTIASETFFAAARDALPGNLVEARDFDYMRACALLSITSIQYGDIERMQLYLGHYFTLLGIQRFHDEAYWPKNITNIEIEERRRLYWSTYTLDIYSSIVWNGSVHTHGANARVRYPTEVEDELITHLSTMPSPQPTNSWLRGWNFTTDLYLTLEHASHRLRARHAQIDDRIDVAAVFGTPVSSSAAVLASINARYATLPSQFKTFSPPTGDRLRDIFGFQAANIQATLLLLRMLLFCTEDDGHSLSDVELKCNIAAELLAVFQTIPTAYLCGISTPLIYHLSGIGMILASVMEGPLSEPGYQKVKSILLSIADLLESLESGLSRAADISKGLRAQVERIDEYMLAQRRHMQGPYDALPINSAGASISLEQHSTSNDNPDLHAVNLDNNQDHAQITATQDAGVEAEGQFANGWLGEFQLPSELLGDWPWSFNLQPESWSLLGTGAGPREGGW